MLSIKVFGPGCAKCKTTYNNAIEAVKITGVQAEVQKVEDIEEMLKYNLLATPVLMIDGKALVKGRVADVAEIKKIIENL